jgi:hypothetical protein
MYECDWDERVAVFIFGGCVGMQGKCLFID